MCPTWQTPAVDPGPAPSPDDAARTEALNPGDEPTTVSRRSRRERAGSSYPALLGVLALSWGSSYLFIKIGVATLPPLSLVAGRLFVGLAVLLVVAGITRTPFPRDRRTVGGLAVLLGLGAIIRMPETRGAAIEASSPAPAPSAASRWWWLRPALLVPSVALAAAGTMFAMYDVVWPQYLNARGYDSLVIGLSISFFAVPILLLTGPGGRLSDRADRRLLVPAALCVVAACAFTYPWLRSIFPILAVGTVESLAVMLVEPSLFAVISESTTASLRGRAMGVGGLFEAGGGAFGAGVLGALYGSAEPLPFLGGATVCLLAAAVCSRALPRHRPPGAAPDLRPAGIARAEVDVV